MTDTGFTVRAGSVALKPFSNTQSDSPAARTCLIGILAILIIGFSRERLRLLEIMGSRSNGNGAQLGGWPCWAGRG